MCDAMDFSLVLSSILGVLCSVCSVWGVHGYRIVILAFSAECMARELHGSVHGYVPARVTLLKSQEKCIVVVSLLQLYYSHTTIAMII